MNAPEDPAKPAPPCSLQAFQRASRLDAWPATPQAPAGHLALGNAGWRSQWPHIALENCNACGLCLLYCPEGAIEWNARRLPVVAADWCKGCAMCVKECPRQLIEMQPEKGRA